MSASQPIDVRDMAIVHRTFRSAYAESAHLVRARPTPSPGRVTFLADHIDFGLEMLHHHHASEDLLRYPLLLERVPEQAAMTAIPGTSPKAALKVLREAGLKATSKDPHRRESGPQPL